MSGAEANYEISVYIQVNVPVGVKASVEEALESAKSDVRGLMDEAGVSYWVEAANVRRAFGVGAG